MPPWLLGLLPTIVDGVKSVFGIEDSATKAARIQAEGNLNLKQGDIDIAQAQVNSASVAAAPWQGAWRSILAFGLVGDFIVRYPLTTLTQFLYSISGHAYNRPIYASDELIIQLLCGLLGLGLMYFRSQDKRAMVTSAVQAVLQQHIKSNPPTEAPKGRYNKETDTYEN